MSNILIMFGSESDKGIYGEIASKLKDAEVRVASAHRDPELVEQLLKGSQKVIIAGAGLAAHLPGVAASKTIRPVIGVPINSNFGGLDSLLSIMQMPGGIPVLSVGINAADEAARNAALMLEQYEFVNIIGNTSNERARRCIEFLEKFSVNYEISDSPNSHAVNIRFTSLSDEPMKDDALVINVPLARSHSPEDVSKLINLTKKGLWVGLNRGENAAIAAIEILNLDNRYASKLEDLRSSMKSSVPKAESISYKDAGVDISKADESNAMIKQLVKQTYNHNTLSELGLFAGLYRFNKNQYENPVLVSSTDGVGTKLKLAVMSGDYTTVGGDIVNHCVNDILVHGAIPLFFLDYFAAGQLVPKHLEGIIKGMTLACVSNSTVLIGGETAELPGLYKTGDFDLAGTIIGVVEKDKIINGQKIVPGDVAIGLASNGLHTNGYSLAIKVLLENSKYSLNDSIPELKCTLKEALLKTHTSYLKPVKALLKKFSIKGMAHITGGGLKDNIVRILPRNCSVEINKNAWEIPPLFKLIQSKGNIAEDEMFHAFNMGVGFVIFVPRSQADAVMQRIEDFNIEAFKLGEVVLGENKIMFKQGSFLKRLFAKKEAPQVEPAPVSKAAVPIDSSMLASNIDNALESTDFPNLGSLYKGKVRDVYTKGNKMTIITTDRISAFDRVLGTIPFKGQMLNQLAVFWFDKTKDIVQNHLISCPDPNVSIAKVCKPYPVEMVVRQFITGSLWRDYDKGNRSMYGLEFPEDLNKYDKFEEPILTPTTKESEGHDLPISHDEIIEKGLISKERLEEIEDVALRLFERGCEVAAKQGLVLVDTKYEFGQDENGNLVLIDEIHTPDSSRYWYAESLENIDEGKDPVELNKEYLRQWLLERGFSGDGEAPVLTPEVKITAALRYAETFEKLTGKKVMVTGEDILKRIEANLR